MSVFGAQQVSKIFAQAEAAKAFDAVTGATREEFGGPLQALFGTADRLQRECIDLALGVVAQAGPDLHPYDVTPIDPPTGADDARRSDIVRPNSQSAANTPPQTAPIGNVAGQQPSGGGWGAMPVADSVPSATPGNGHAAGATGNGETISTDYPFTSHFIDVFGSRMHYIDEGEGDPILLLHGNATWSYAWRNVIPHLKPYGRCIAPDLIGFGLSDKPNIQYEWVDQAKYLEEFIGKLGLKKITIVANDFGISLAQLYAMRHEENVKRIAFFEGVFKTFKSLEEAYTTDFRPLFKQFRSGGEGGEGYKLLVDRNLFIEQLLPRAAGRELTEEELRRYRDPFKEVRSRIPIWRFARSVPIGGAPKDVWAIMTKTTEWFKQTTIPKLLFYATPGGLVTAEFVDWARANLKNLKVVHAGSGVHYLTETSPHLIGRELVKWLAETGRV